MRPGLDPGRADDDDGVVGCGRHGGICVSDVALGPEDLQVSVVGGLGGWSMGGGGYDVGRRVG